MGAKPSSKLWRRRASLGQLASWLLGWTMTASDRKQNFKPGHFQNWAPTYPAGCHRPKPLPGGGHMVTDAKRERAAPDGAALRL